MPKRTLKEICGVHNITRDILDYARAEGINVYKDSEMAEWVKNRRGKTDSKGPQIPAEERGEVLSLEELEDKLASAPTPQIAQMHKTQIAGLREAFKARCEMGEWMRRDEVSECFTMIGAAVRAAVNKLENDLPPKGVGLDEAAMQKEFRPVIRQILELLSNRESEFWNGND